MLRRRQSFDVEEHLFERAVAISVSVVIIHVCLYY